jgi:hypothetical protein
MDNNGNDLNHSLDYLWIIFGLSLDYSLSYSKDKNYFSMLGWLQTPFPFEFLLLMSALFANLEKLIFFDKVENSFDCQSINAQP